MRNILLSIVFFSIFSCKNSESKTELTSSTIKEINEIIKVIIAEDSLEVFKSANGKKMLCKELIKLNIYMPDRSDITRSLGYVNATIARNCIPCP